jgi:hypothetical protein
MTESLFDIFSRKDFSEPPEGNAIKAYIKEHFQADAEINIRDFEIIIIVTSAGLANTLRYHARKMQTAANTKKRLILRIR